ncbi:hypothetical protein M514_12203 [Trichuris suis]|uniref:Uncharacterized protein n=1 Tax=Trichuris suis TaxID=68888 RepID=A0A085N458_9BILA|nr:hypothetical protein M513_12203 [Trichuris suis]KFD64254.1 hypothetical protein M514_12203 [Trichuris suis]
MKGGITGLGYRPNGGNVVVTLLMPSFNNDPQKSAFPLTGFTAFLEPEAVAALLLARAHRLFTKAVQFCEAGRADTGSFGL